MNGEIDENIRYWQSRGVQSGTVATGESRGKREELRRAELQDADPNSAVRVCELCLHKMYIGYNGDVLLCCMDWRRRVVLGNVRNQTLREVWHGEKYREYRRRQARNSVAGPRSCADCFDTCSIAPTWRTVCEPFDFPASIQIETTSCCNANCDFCPYPETSKTEPQGVMDEELFEEIVDQVSHYPVQMIQPFLNNDPLMDQTHRAAAGARSSARIRDRVYPADHQWLTAAAGDRTRAGRDAAGDDSHQLQRSDQRRLPARPWESTAYAVLRQRELPVGRDAPPRLVTRLVVTAILLATNNREVDATCTTTGARAA